MRISEGKRVALALSCLVWVYNPLFRRGLTHGGPETRRYALRCHAQSLVIHDRILEGKRHFIVTEYPPSGMGSQ